MKELKNVIYLSKSNYIEISFTKSELYGWRKGLTKPEFKPLKQNRNRVYFAISGHINSNSTATGRRICGAGQCIDDFLCTKYYDLPLIIDIGTLWSRYHLKDVREIPAKDLRTILKLLKLKDYKDYRSDFEGLSNVGRYIAKKFKLENFEGVNVVDRIESIYLKYYKDAEKAHAVCAHDWNELREALAYNFMLDHTIFTDYKITVISDYISSAKIFNTSELLEELKQY